MVTTVTMHAVLRLSVITACTCLALTHAYDPWRSLLKTGLKEYFQCPPCEGAVCPALPPSCTPVLEAGVCGCCHVCARRAGEACGFRDSICAPGLDCVTSATHSRAMFQQLRTSTAVCLPAAPREYGGDYASLKELLNGEMPHANDIKRWRY